MLKRVFRKAAGKPASEEMKAHAEWEQARAAFFRAIKREDFDTVTEIAKKYPDQCFEWKNRSNLPATHYALKRGSQKMLAHLFELRASPNQKAVYEPEWPSLSTFSLLEKSVKKKSIPWIVFLLQHGANQSYIDTKDAKIQDILSRGPALRKEYLQTKIEKKKSEAAEQADEASRKWETDCAALFKAIKSGDCGTISRIVKEYPKEAFKWRSDNKLSPAHYALSVGNIASFRTLLDIGADKEERQWYQSPEYKFIEKLIPYSLLDRAATDGKEDFVYALIQRGASPQTRYAAKNGKIDNILKCAETIRKEYAASLNGSAEEKRAEQAEAAKPDTSSAPSPYELLQGRVARLERQLEEARNEIRHLQQPQSLKLDKKSITAPKSR